MTLDRNKIFAFIADGDNDGIVAVAVPTPGGPMMLPLVSLGDEEKLAEMSRIATNIAKDSGKTIRMYEFTEAKERAVFTKEGGGRIQ